MGYFALVVEDHYPSALLILEILDALHISTLLATSGDVAINWLEREDFQCDLLVVDLLLPRKPGLEVIAAAKKKQLLPKIIVVSGANQQVDLRTEAMGEIMIATLEKPLDVRLLMAHAKACLAIA